MNGYTDILTKQWCEILKLYGSFRFVGGKVRNHVLHLPPTNDVDIAFYFHDTHVDHRAFLFDLAYEFSKKNKLTINKKGYYYGVVKIFNDHISIETALLRIDVKAKKRHAKVSFIQNFEKDSLRRDFTLNALYQREDGIIEDFHGTKQDIKHRIWRFIGDPQKRIEEDALRILRLWRFYSIYGGNFDLQTLYATLGCHENMITIPPSKREKELMKLKKGKYYHRLCDILIQNGLDTNHYVF